MCVRTKFTETRYPLAEYRYGREEMLSLYDKNFKLPELLPKFNKLFIEKMQSPLALLPPTADDDTVIISMQCIFALGELMKLMLEFVYLFL